MLVFLGFLLSIVSAAVSFFFFMGLFETVDREIDWPCAVVAFVIAVLLALGLYYFGGNPGDIFILAGGGIVIGAILGVGMFCGAMNESNSNKARDSKI